MIAIIKDANIPLTTRPYRNFPAQNTAQFLGINQVDFAATKGLGLGMLELRERGFSQEGESTTCLGWPFPELEQVIESY